MRRICFTEPIVVWLDPRNPGDGKRRISHVAEGLAALHRYGLRKLRGEPAWERAAAALAEAESDPSQATVETARRALLRLAHRAGAVAEPDARHGEACGRSRLDPG